MAIRKPLIEKPKKKELPHVDERKVNKKLDVNSLPPAIVEGKLVVPLETEIIVVKPYNGKTQRSICTIKKIDDDTVSAWDETLNRWYLFNPAEVEGRGVTIRVSRTPNK